MTTTVTRRVPPQPLIDLISPVVRLVLRSPLHAALDKAVLVLHITGRKTGHHYDIPVGYTTLDGQLLVVTQHGWRTNLRGGAELEVTDHGGRRSMHADLEEDPSRVAETVRQVIERLGRDVAERLFGIKIQGSAIPSRTELEQPVREFDLAIITLTPRGNPAP